MMLFILLFSRLVFASNLVWELPLEKAVPKAALFEPSTSAIYISLQSGEGAGIAKVSLEGKILDRALAVAHGEAGPLRAFDGNLYWVGGEKVWQVPLSDGKRKPFMDAPEGVNDIAVDKDGTVYLATSSGIQGANITNKPVTGLFILNRILYFIESGYLREYSLQDKKLSSSKLKFCSECNGLERNSAGVWLSLEKGKLIQVKDKKKTVLKSTGQGRIAYVFQMDSKNDFLVIPQSNSVRAER